MISGMTLLAAAAAEAAQGAAQTGLPQLNANHFAPQLFWLAVTFVTLLLAMWAFALPRIGSVLKERGDRIAGDIAAAGRLKAETDKALADYEQALADARANASGIAKQMRDRLGAETDAEKARVDADIARKLQDADARIAATKTKALSAVDDIAADTASAVVSKLIGQDVSADEVRRALRLIAAE